MKIIDILLENPNIEVNLPHHMQGFYITALSLADARYKELEERFRCRGGRKDQDWNNAGESNMTDISIENNTNFDVEFTAGDKKTYGVEEQQSRKALEDEDLVSLK